jgi:pSer/pThr/pTyr-binding forkhead associated (FHA) protein
VRGRCRSDRLPSGVHARIKSTAQGFILVHLSRNNKTLLNDTPVESTSPVKVGDRIRIGFTGPAIEILAIRPASQDGRISARPSRPTRDTRPGCGGPAGPSGSRRAPAA